MPEAASASASAGDEAASTARAATVLRAALDAGVRHLVVSPGSRSQALAFLAVELERAGLVDLHVAVDERGAGFFALGVGRETGRPAAVIATSGTAIANLHPAVLEAHEGRVPLLVLSADRPRELHGVRANQTTEQLGMFAGATRAALTLPAASAGDDESAAREAVLGAALAAAGSGTGHPGPAQVNVELRDPLASEPSAATRRVLLAPIGDAPPVEPATGGPGPIVLDRSRRTLVVAGADSGRDAEALAHAGAWPLVAEVTSGSRFGRNLVVRSRALLDMPELRGAVERVVVFGHPTLSRQVAALLADPSVEAVVVDAARDADRADPGRRATIASAASVADGPPDRAWLGSWLAADRALAERGDGPDPRAATSSDPSDRLAHARRELEAVRRPIDRGLLVDALWRATWPHDRLVLGASRLIRVADERLGGKPVRVVANRGLAGIDGTIATGLGVAAASRAAERGGVTRVLLGDLAFLHDAGSLLVTPGEAAPRIQVVVGDDGGGTIFDGLEAGALGDADARDRVLTTPRPVDIGAIAAAYGWEVRAAATAGELDQALTGPAAGPVLVHVRLPRVEPA